MILACKNINKAYGIDTVLESISFLLEAKEKAAIVGVNGAGKSTIFKIIAGELTPDGGDFFLQKDISIGYLSQIMEIDSDTSIYDEMLSALSSITDLENKLRAMEQEMSLLSGEALNSHMEQYARLQHEFEKKDGYSIHSRIQGILKGLGFCEEEFQKPVCTLSGGQKTRVYLGRLLLTQPELLLLDEPTNHLDIASVEWLEGFLKGYSGAVLLISHDRYFLDKTVTKIIEIEHKKSAVYHGNYSYYWKEKETKRQTALKQYLDQQKELKRQEEIIKTLRSYNREKSIKRAESREKNLSKIERIEKPESAPEKMHLKLEPKIQSGNDVLFADELQKGFGDSPLFSHVSFSIKRGEKTAIIGPNGIGKSTLFKLLLGHLNADSGSIRFGTNVHIGYYDQEQQNLAEEKTIFQEISDTYPKLTNGEIRNVLAAFVFTGDDVYKTISSLSGGEKGRVALAKIMLSKANLLMLDEPTNHLDLFSKGILEQAIQSYTGTVIYISHDRYFINQTASRILVLTPQGVISYLGNYQYYLEKLREKEISDEDTVTVSMTKPVSASDTKMDWMRQKEIEAEKRKVRNKLAKLETEIETTERKIKELETLLFQEEVSTDADKARELFEEKETLEAALLELYENWESLQE